MKAMTIDEAKKMIGTEFTFVFSDGDTIPGYVKKFDPEVGLTALSLDTKSRDGYAPEVGSPSREADGTYCLIAIRSENYEDKDAFLDKVFLVLETIRDEGVFVTGSCGTRIGMGASCAFGG